MNRTLKDAKVKSNIINRTNSSKNISTASLWPIITQKDLRLSKPYEFICTQWTKSPELFILNPHHHSLELYTFAWINRNRRLSKEYDLLTTSTENFIYLAMSKVMLQREYS